MVKIKNGLEIGARLVMSGGLPYTPNLATSYEVTNWEIFGRPMPNYDQLNGMQLDGFNQLDLRADKDSFLINGL